MSKVFCSLACRLTKAFFFAQAHKITASLTCCFAVTETSTLTSTFTGLCARQLCYITRRKNSCVSQCLYQETWCWSIKFLLFTEHRNYFKNIYLIPLKEIWK